MKPFRNYLGIVIGRHTCIAVYNTVPRSRLMLIVKCQCGHDKNIGAGSYLDIIKKGSCFNCDTPKLGDRFGRLTFISLSNEKGKSGGRICNLKCDCGNYCSTSISRLNLKQKQSCGCLYKEHLYNDKPALNHIGKRYHKFVVLKILKGKVKKGKSFLSNFLCKCDCGNKFSIPSCRIKAITSCGCSARVDAKLTYSLAQDIRESHKYGYTASQLAKMFRVSIFNIRDVLANKSYVKPRRLRSIVSSSP